jgi:hypothetical protein
MAGSERAEKVKEKKKRRKKEKHIADHLEQKWIGTRTEVFSRIAAKEAEIRSKTSEERARAERLIEDAKGQAAAIKRKATLEEIGKDVRAKIIAEAEKDAEGIEASTAQDIAQVEKTGRRNLDKAVDFIIQAVISSEHSRS